MATNSILKSVTIRKKSLGKGLVRALETAASRKGKTVVVSKKHRTLHGEKIKEVFKGM